MSQMHHTQQRYHKYIKEGFTRRRKTQLYSHHSVSKVLVQKTAAASCVSEIFSFCWLLDLLQIRSRAAILEELNWEYLLLVWALTPPLRKACCSHVSAVGKGYAGTSRHWSSG